MVQYQDLSNIRVKLTGTPLEEYFVSQGLDKDAASELHLKYYSTYGLALVGLVRHHQVGM